MAKKTPVAKKKPSKKKAPTKPAKRSVLIERTLAASMARMRKELDAELALIRRRRSSIAEDFYDIAESLLRIDERRLYAADDCGSVEELVDKHELFSKETARKLLSVAAEVSRESATELGFERAFAAVRVARATPEPDTVDELLRGNAKIGNKALREASARELRDAARELGVRERVKRGEPTKRDAVEKRALAAAKRLRAALRGRGVKQPRIEIVFTRDDVEVLVHLSLDEAEQLS